MNRGKEKYTFRAKFFWIIFPLFAYLIYLIIKYTTGEVAIVAQCFSIILAAMIIIRGSKEKPFFNPYYLFSLCPITLAIYFPAMSSYYLLEINELSYVFAIMNMLFFYLGMSICSYYVSNNDVQGATEKKVSSSIPGPSTAKWALFFCFFGFLPVCYAIASGIEDWNSIKFVMSSFPFYPAIAYFPYTAIYLALYSKNKPVILTVIILAGITTMFAITKTMVMFYLFSLLFGYEKTGGTQKTRKLLIIGFLSLIVFLYLDNVYNQLREATQYEELWQERSEAGLSTSQLKTYLYFETPWCNFQYILDNITKHTFGLWSIRPLVILFRLNVFFPISYDYPEMEPYTSFNALGYIIYFYHDFGYIGSCLAVFVLGVFVSYLYEKSKRVDNPFLDVVVLFVLRAVMMMFFNNHFATDVYIFSAIITMIFANCITKLHSIRYNENNRMTEQCS